MGFNFPSSPAVGALHPDPAQVGLPQYRWDGTMWVTVVAPTMPRYQRISLSGISSVDVQVPTGATAARLSLTAYYSASANAATYLQLSVTAGVFLAGTSYLLSGPFHFGGATTVIGGHNNVSTPGIALAYGPHSNISLPSLADGIVQLTRPNTSVHFGGMFRGYAYDDAAGRGGVHTTHTTVLLSASAGSALNILAFRLLGGGSAWTAESYLHVEWL